MDLVVQDLSDIDLISLVKDGSCSEAFCELVGRHSGIYLDTLYKYAPASSYYISREEFIDDKDLNIYEAIINYDPDKGAKFSTYLGNSTRWKCLNTVNKNKKRKTYSLDTEHRDSIEYEVNLESGQTTEDFTKNLTSVESLDIIRKEAELCGDPRIKTIFDMRYFECDNKPTTWKIIADKINLSIQGAIDIHNRFIIKTKTKHEL